MPPAYLDMTERLPGGHIVRRKDISRETKARERAPIKLEKKRRGHLGGPCQICCLGTVCGMSKCRKRSLGRKSNSSEQELSTVRDDWPPLLIMYTNMYFVQENCQQEQLDAQPDRNRR